jgi:hypothetical protein
MLASSGTLKAAPPGFLEGRLKIFAPTESTGIHPPNVLAPSYKEYPLVILSEDGTRKVARVMADSDGAFRVALPPGAYILDVQDRVSKYIRATPQLFKVESNQTAWVVMLIYR